MRGTDYFRQKIQELELKAPSEKSNFYREYTAFILNKMKTVSFIDSEGKDTKVNAFFANPERAIAKIHEDRTLTLPIITVAIDDIDEDSERRRADHILDINTVWDKKSQRALRIISKASKPLNLAFSINIWAKYIEDVNQILETIMFMFNPALVFKTSNNSSTKSYIEQITDNSTMSAPDKDDRVIRKMIVLTAEAYLAYPKYLVTSTGEIEKYNIDVIIDEN